MENWIGNASAQNTPLVSFPGLSQLQFFIALQCTKTGGKEVMGTKLPTVHLATSRPLEVIHVINAPRPSFPFSLLFSVAQTKKQDRPSLVPRPRLAFPLLVRGEPGNKAKTVPYRQEAI